jgi:uncharacterized membrane protein affecting hemolysin expression
MSWWPYSKRLERIERKLDRILLTEAEIMATMAELEIQVKANTDAEDSAVLLINGIAKQLSDLIAAGADPAKLQALVDQLKSHSDALAAAVVANTKP